MAIKLTSGQQTFVKQLARKTGLNSRVIAAWVVAEEGGANSGAAKGRQAAKNHNWLNIAYYDSGAGSITKNKVWSDPVSAADATAQFLEGKKFGASPGIRKILGTVGRSQEDQIRAIASSGWASSGYNGGNNLRQLLGQVPAPGKASGSVGQAISQAGAHMAASPRSSTTTTVTPGALPEPADPTALMAALQKSQMAPAPQQTVPLVQPGAAAGPTFSKSYRAVQPSGGPQRPAQSGVDMLLAVAAQTPQGELPQAPTVTTTTAPAAAATQSAPKAPAVSPQGSGKVVVVGSAERPGRGLQKPILSFLHQLAGVSGRTVTVTTGTNHNQYVAGRPGVQSDHWDGNAADLGLGGDARQSSAVARQGDLIAAHAIQLAAGISFKKAYAIAKAGGVHNFNTKAGRVQVLWKTMVGGNHYNHVHVGVNPGR